MAKQNWSYIDVSTLDFDDEKTWKLIQEGKTDGVFQLESAGMKEVCQRVKPTCMEDLIAILALYRPDTMGELEHYIRRKNGEEGITYLHPDLVPILGKTYGCMIYQESVMAIVKKFAGFSDAEADKFRKGIGKKDPKLVEEQAEKFRKRALEKGYPVDVVNAIADDLKKKGGYMFNKGHSTGYGITSYKTAYLKANYPDKFMCALLSNQKKSSGQTDYEGVGYYIVQCLEMGIKVKNPDINLSQKAFTVIDGEILFGLDLIKGVGSNAVEAILELRPFNSFEDFLERTEKRGEVNKTAVISLIKAGAFDFTKRKRADLLKMFGEYRFKNGLDSIKPIKNVNKTHIEKLIQAGIIKSWEASDKEFCLEQWNKWRKLQHEQEWQENEMAGNEFKWEYDSISYHLLGDPFEKAAIPAWETFEEGDSFAKLGGTVISIKKTKIKKGKQVGKQMAFLNVDTSEGIREVVAFADKWAIHQSRLEKGAMVVLVGKKQGEKMILGTVMSLEEYETTETQDKE